MKGRFFRNDELRDSHDMRMDALALKVSSILNGEKCFDAACVCALLAAFGLATDTTLDREKRREAFNLVLDFMRRRTTRLSLSTCTSGRASRQNSMQTEKLRTS